MKKVFLVYKTDVHHSYKSRELIGIATNKSSAKSIILDRIVEEDGQINPEDAKLLDSKYQTQGYIGEGEFQFEEFETDILL